VNGDFALRFSLPEGEESGYFGGMRALRVCVTFAFAATMASACGDDGDNSSPAAGEGGTGGKSGGGSGGSNKGGSNATGAGAGGKNAASGSGGTTSNAGTSANGGAELAGGGGSESVAGSGTGGGDAAGAGAGGVAGDGGEASASGGASAGNAAGGAAGECNVASTDKIVFASSVLYTGSLGGLSGADSKCQGLADAAGLCGTFKAWLSDTTANAATRLTQADGNYVLLDGQVVAAGWTGLTSGTLQHAIDLTEKKTTVPTGTVKCGGSQQIPVWTGAPASGVNIMNGSCSDWGSQSASPGAIFGNALAKNGAWSGMCQIVAVCQSTAALYCVQQ
jgi:hypothetical protein